MHSQKRGIGECQGPATGTGAGSENAGSPLGRKRLPVLARTTCLVLACLSAAGLGGGMIGGLSGGRWAAAQEAQAEPRLGPRAARLFARENLVAWCIVPFDAAKRNPEQRVQMLRELGLSACAYDWREEHVPTFEREILAYQAGEIRFFAFWAWHDQAAELFRRYELRPQFWVMLSDPGEMPAAERVARAADGLMDLARRTQELGAALSLYNHGGWAGQPETLIAVCRELHNRGFGHVGIAYNFHHAHDRIADWPKIFPQLKPWLHCLNINGMNDGAQPKILAVGSGQHERAMLRVVLEHDYQGPIGVLDHLETVDSQVALQANLTGLAQIVEEFQAQDLLSAPVPAAASTAYAQALVDQAAALGDARRGARVFADAKFACLSCHKVGTTGGAVGPALTDPVLPRSPVELALSLLWPQHDVAPEYVVWQALMADGRVLSGYRRDLPDGRWGLANTATGEVTMVAAEDVEELRSIGSPMPEGLAQSMSSLQRLDLLQYLRQIHSGGETQAAFLEEAHRRAQTHQLQAEPTAVPRPPLVTSQWTLAEHPVNRDRIYDFYKKQALQYQAAPVPPLMLGYFHSLDGPNTGHWGNQTEATWASGRWNQTLLDHMQAGVFRGAGVTVPRAICLQLGDQKQLSICFDPDTLTYPVLWKDGFISFSEVRHGFMDGLRLEGTVVQQNLGPPPSGPSEYLGLYRDGPRVAFAYRVGEVVYLDSPWAEGDQLVRTVAPLEEHPLRQMVSGGVGRNPQVISTPIELGTGTPYAVDTIVLPTENPWRALLFCSGHDFLPDGSAMVCTMQGDVWHVSGLTSSEAGTTPRQARWRRYASGLHQPLGLVVADGVTYVLCRDQLVALHDLNGDGEADHYRCQNRQFVTSPGGHDFICGLERDAEGHFYTASSNQGLLRLAADGRSVEVLATGFRNPDGLGRMPDGTLTVPCSEGEWTPGSMITALPPSGSRERAWLGSDGPPHFGYPGPRGGATPALPWLYLPRGIDNSAGGQIWVNSDRWGPLQGQMLHFSFGTGSHFLLLQDRLEQPEPGLPAWIQGAVVPLVGDFLSGAHRGRFNPVDGQLYVTGMNGWGSYTPDDGCFQRVRYTGAAVRLPIAIKVHSDGVWLKFTEPLTADVVCDPAASFAQAWNYRYSSSYGSPEFSPSHPEMVGHDWVAITQTSLSPQGDELFLQMPDLQPVNQLHLSLALSDEARREPGLRTDLFVTIHQLGTAFDKWPVPQFGPPRPSTHPIFADLSRQQEQVPNPWLTELPDAVEIEVLTGENLSYQTPQLQVRAGQAVRLTLKNIDSVPHNWVLLQPDRLAQVGQLTNQMLADPAAGQKQYVPETDDVICYTDVVNGGGSFTIYFRAPQEPGRYPFLCSFPGHWMVMNGVLTVTAD